MKQVVLIGVMLGAMAVGGISLAQELREKLNLDQVNRQNSELDAARKKATEQKIKEKRDAAQSAHAGPTDAALLVSALRRQVSRCWMVEAGARAVPVVNIEFELDQTGRVIGEPRTVSPGAGVDFEMAAGNAIRAVKQCQPYALPQDKFHLWRAVELSFDARRLAP